MLRLLNAIGEQLLGANFLAEIHSRLRLTTNNNSLFIEIA
jgi:hypothetical protein